MKIPIIIEENAGIDRGSEPVRVGVPFPQGALQDADALALRDPDSELLPLQTQVLDRWSDQSCRWVLVDFQATVASRQIKQYSLEPIPAPRSALAGDKIVLTEMADAIEVATGPATIRLSKAGRFPFDQIIVGGTQVLDADSSGMLFVEAQGRTWQTKIAKVAIETSGPLRATIYFEGCFFHSAQRQPLAVFFSRLHFFSGQAAVQLDFTVRNPRAAIHPGGLWDLGDAGSIFFDDLSLHLRLADGDKGAVFWSEAPTAALKPAEGGALEIYQDSSGGENWQSRNHVNRFGKVMNSFRGYRASSGDNIILQGERALPTVMLVSENRCLTAAIQSFWQNFPKAIEASENQIAVRLFPAQYADAFELQGGEQKSHTVYLDFAERRESGTPLAWTYEPLVPCVEPEWYDKSAVFPYMIAQAQDPNRDYLNLVHSAIEGDNNFFQRREIIDEYGWRHFGELHADHEAAYYAGPKPIISHYNNQYDAVYGFALHYARSGDRRWFELMHDLARHVIDIDIYHTLEDKAAYSGGLFWHTDHYTDAATCTHRTFARKTMDDKALKDYGGGPSNEHLYTTGLMHYYFLTGDAPARDAVLGLADWVTRMDDGKLTPLRFLSRAATGLASQTASRDYHNPGRGAGNAINALLDGYRLSRDAAYLNKAEELIRRCIHPASDIDALTLLDAERRWSYLVFLQALGKYLDCKIEWNMADRMLDYAGESLLAYARWMALREVPYSRVLDRVEYPTETWIVHDLRKSNIFEWAGKYGGGEERQQFFAKAKFFYEYCLRDLEKFPSKTCTRPLVMLLHYGAMHGYFRLRSDGLKVEWSPSSETSPARESFKPQRRIAEERVKLIAGGAVMLGVLVVLIVLFNSAIFASLR